MEALLLIDIQNDYFPGGAIPLHEPILAASNAAAILSVFREQRKPVIHIQHIATRADATFFLPNTEGAQFHQSVTPLTHEAVIVKHFPNSFRETPLLETLRKLNVDALTVVGMMTHMCIDTTVRAAADLGFRCTLVADACATRTLSLGEQTVSAESVQLAYLAALSGSFAHIVNIRETLIPSYTD